MIVELILWVSFISSFAGIIFLIARKMPIVMALPEESLEYKETFINFLDRKRNEFPSQLDKIRIGFLMSSNKRLMRLKIVSLKIHNKAHIWTEFLNKKLHHDKYGAPDINEIDTDNQIASFVTCDGEDNAENRETKI